jgi:hypothetical protein
MRIKNIDFNKTFRFCYLGLYSVSIIASVFFRIDIPDNTTSLLNNGLLAVVGLQGVKSYNNIKHKEVEKEY